MNYELLDVINNNIIKRLSMNTIKSLSCTCQLFNNSLKPILNNTDSFYHKLYEHLKGSKKFSKLLKYFGYQINHYYLQQTMSVKFNKKKFIATHKKLYRIYNKILKKLRKYISNCFNPNTNINIDFSINDLSLLFVSKKYNITIDTVICSIKTINQFFQPVYLSKLCYDCLFVNIIDFLPSQKVRYLTLNYYQIIDNDPLQKLITENLTVTYFVIDTHTHWITTCSNIGVTLDIPYNLQILSLNIQNTTINKRNINNIVFDIDHESKISVNITGQIQFLLISYDDPKSTCFLNLIGKFDHVITQNIKKIKLNITSDTTYLVINCEQLIIAYYGDNKQDALDLILNIIIIGTTPKIFLCHKSTVYHTKSAKRFTQQHSLNDNKNEYITPINLISNNYDNSNSCFDSDVSSEQIFSIDTDNRYYNSEPLTYSNDSDSEIDSDYLPHSRIYLINNINACIELLLTPISMYNLANAVKYYVEK